MSEARGRVRLVLSPSALNDIRVALNWSRERFGASAAERYRDLIKQALRDIAADPERPESSDRPDLARGVRTYHLLFSRDRARGPSGFVRKPRHFLVYRRRGGSIIDVIRVLHDARELHRHIPGEDRNLPAF